MSDSKEKISNSTQMITEDYGVQMDELCVVLVKKHTRISGAKKGEEYFKPVGYYNNLEQLLHALIDKDIQNFRKLSFIVNRIRTLKLIVTDFMHSGRSAPFRSTIRVARDPEHTP